MPNRIALSAALIALSIAAPATVSATAAEARPLFGLADNTVQTLDDARFQKSGIKQVRILVPYDAVARGGKKRKELDLWFAVAKSQGIEPLVSWYRTYSCSPKCAAKRLPSVKSYVANVKRFRKRYPWVKRFSTWNEINFPAAQPTGRNPKRAAQFYLAHSKICAAGRCSVLTGDFRLNGSKFSANWLKTFKKAIGRGRHTWGIVPHPEINAFHTRYTRQFLRSVRGNAWAVEAGAVNFFRPELRPSLSRQTRAMTFLMTRYVNVSSRIKRIYMYHWRAAPRQPKWDSALLNIDGTPRNAYFEFFKGLGRTAPTLATP
jgi:hypothetical protein